MAQIREIKKRIKSITNTQKVTHAMELVSAAKMRKAQSAALSARPYADSLHQILSSVSPKTKDVIGHPLTSQSENTRQLLIVISSDRGLAGGLNLNVFREILRTDIKDAKYITVGKKARDFAAKTGGDLIASYASEELPYFEIARILAKGAQEMFIGKEVGKVSLIYPYFESTIRQPPKWVQVLPIASMEEIYQEAKTVTDFLFEPSADQIIDLVLKHHILTKIYQALVEAKAAEHSARMVAMKNATDAAGDLVDDLTLAYNQARQETITKELLDIITAQKAFE